MLLESARLGQRWQEVGVEPAGTVDDGLAASRRLVGAMDYGIPRFMPPSVRPRGLVVDTGGWADVDLGESFPIDSIKLYFLNTNAAPKRFKILGADDLQFSHPQILVDQSAADYHPNGTRPQVFQVNGTRCRRIRLWLTRPSTTENSLMRPKPTGPTSPNAPVEVRQMEVMSGGKNVALMRPMREIGTQWDHGHAPFLVDGMPSANDGIECPPEACPTTAAPLLRKTFAVQQPVKRATLYVAALGMADVTINGRPVTDAVLGPPFTDYTKRVVYLTHDITPLLANGENVIGAKLGNGFFSTPQEGFWRASRRTRAGAFVDSDRNRICRWHSSSHSLR